MSNVVNCIRCEKLFATHGRPVCYECKKNEEEAAVEIRKFLKKNPDASANEICEELDVSVELLSILIDEGRVVMKHTESPLTCQICGRQIARGKICPSCASELTDGLVESKRPVEKSSNQVTTRYFNKKR